MKNIKETSKRLNEEFKDSDAILGKGCLTMANRNTSARAMMFSSHTEQFTVLLEPDIPGVFTNYENIVGKHSSAYHKTDSDYLVIKKIEKFKGSDCGEFVLVLYDIASKKYDVIIKQVGQRLTESYGYRFNTENIDSKKENDVIKKGEVLYKSTSFDENMNYRYGKNVPCVYITDENVIEDALEISETLQKQLRSVEYHEIEISLNENDILTNLYGTRKTYKAFPDIGEESNKIVANKRRINYAQSLFELRDDNLMKVNFDSDVPYYGGSSAEGPREDCLKEITRRVVDVSIYSNKSLADMNRFETHRQLVDYYENELRYHQEIYDCLSKIMESGMKYSDTLSYMYKYSKDYLDPEFVFKDDRNNIFSNMILKITVENILEVDVGSKLTGRCGDKGVISKVTPDSEMPYTEDGRIIHMKRSLVGVPNRENPAQLYEVELSFLAYEVNKRITKAKYIDEKQDILLTFLYMVNKKQYEKMCEFLSKASDKDIKSFFDNLAKDRIYCYQPPFYGNITLDQIDRIYKTFDIKPVTCYINKWDRKKRIMNDLVVGEIYILKLKHHPKSKFSATSSSYIDSKDTPSKSSSSKNNRSLYQKTPIRFGDMETLILSMSKFEDALPTLINMYSASVKGRRQMSNLYEMNVLDYDKVEPPEKAYNRNAEIFKIYLKTKGLELEINEEDTIEEIDY